MDGYYIIMESSDPVFYYEGQEIEIEIPEGYIGSLLRLVKRAKDCQHAARFPNNPTLL